MNGYLSTETINLSVYTLKRDISGGFKYIHYYYVVLLVSSPSQLGHSSYICYNYTSSRLHCTEMQ